MTACVGLELEELIMENGGGGKGASAVHYTKESLKSKLDENHLDLSLSNLEMVPVQALLDFSLLTHLVKLDLSKNRLTSLPDDFGTLPRLQHLDLYQNKLTTLPLSFARLATLKWLDLRDNEIDAALRAAAGECLNEAACRNCAKQVVAYMKTCQSEAERRRQKQLQEERVRESARKLEEELERQKVQLAKKAQKEARRQELAAVRAATSTNQSAEDGPTGGDSEHSAADVSREAKSRQKKSKSKSGGWSCGAFLFGVLLFIAGMFLSFYVYCQTNAIVGPAASVTADSDICVAARLHASHATDAARRLAEDLTVWAVRAAESAKTRVEEWVN